MRVLFLHNFYQIGGGEDTVYRAEVDLLRERGHEVSAIEFHNNDIQSTTDKIKAGLFGIYSPESATMLQRKIRAFKPDVLHIHNLFPLASPSVLYAARRAGVPTVLTLHNFRLVCPSAVLLYQGDIYEKSIPKIFPVDAVMKGVYRQSRVQTASVALITGIHKVLGTWRQQVNRFVALTEFSRQIFLKSSLGLRPEQVAVKPNFVFDQGFDEQKEDYFAFVGRLSVEKGLPTVIEAFAGTSHRLKLIGTGPEEGLARQAAEQHPNIEFVGKQTRDEVRRHVMKAKAVVLPSIVYENCPMVALEAMSAATPVLTTAIGGQASIVRHGVSGLHFPLKDAATLREQVNRLATDAAQALALSQGARRDFLERFAPEVNYQQLVQIYQEAIDEAARQGKR